VTVVTVQSDSGHTPPQKLLLDSLQSAAEISPNVRPPLIEITPRGSAPSFTCCSRPGVAYSTVEADVSGPYVVSGHSHPRGSLCSAVRSPDSIHRKQDEAEFAGATQMYVDPTPRVDCAACVPASARPVLMRHPTMCQKERKNSCGRTLRFARSKPSRRNHSLCGPSPAVRLVRNLLSEPPVVFHPSRLLPG